MSKVGKRENEKAKTSRRSRALICFTLLLLDKDKTKEESIRSHMNFQKRLGVSLDDLMGVLNEYLSRKIKV